MLLQYIALTHCRWSWRLWNNYRKPKIFTKHELHSAYNLVCIREGDESKTAFHTTRGHYEYLVMPYGLSNAPAVFQSFINKIFKDLIDRCVIAYIYDILIYSSSYDIRHVKTVLAHLCQRQLYIKAEKCELHKNFLGYIISQKGVEMDTSKVKAVTDWPEPTTIKCSSSGGFANFYRWFIHNYSSIASLLTSLLRGKPRRLQWSEQAHVAFILLKKSFTSVPILRHPDPSRPFIIEVDASSCGIGAVLSQCQGNPGKVYHIFLT
ncbi:hypothetical protein QTP86_004088 [Hemibagrus guttatus]|nr:hypothetical protein QTP86_004088 [Hemibagrus guttatus]